MKKHYEKMCMTPLGFDFEGSLFAGSTDSRMRIRATGQEVEDVTFDSAPQYWGDEPEL